MQGTLANFPVNDYPREVLMFGRSKNNSDIYAEDIRKIIDFMNTAAEGNMSAVDETSFHNPELAKAYNNLLKKTLAANNLFVMQMNDAMIKIGDSSVVKNMMEEVNSQAEAVSTIPVSGKELENSITNVQYAVQNIQQNSHTLMKTTKDCADEMSSSISIIEKSAEEVSDINSQIAVFKENAENITKILDQIKDLADNSSLLALNASIEAARAGEAGRGFAIVAQQVGELSKNTTSCADSVVNYVNELLESINTLATAIKSTTDHLKDGTKNVSVSLKNLNEMTDQLSKMRNDIDSIFDEINTQSGLTEEFIALGNTVAGGFETLNSECFTTGEHLYKISRLVDNVRSNMARQRSDLSMIDWITIYQVDHLIFTWRQYNNLIGFEHLKIEQVNNPKGCKLGKWFAAQTDSRIKDSAPFKQAFRLHEELHTHAVNCFNAAAAGDRETGMIHFEKAYDVYQKLVQTLEELKKFVASIGYKEYTDIKKK